MGWKREGCVERHKSQYIFTNIVQFVYILLANTIWLISMHLLENQLAVSLNQFDTVVQSTNIHTHLQMYALSFFQAEATDPCKHFLRGVQKMATSGSPLPGTSPQRCSSIALLTSSQQRTCKHIRKGYDHHARSDISQRTVNRKHASATLYAKCRGLQCLK